MYPHQSERLTGALEGARLQALVATTAANIAYIAGVPSLLDGGHPGRGASAIFTGQGTTLVLPAAAAVSAVLEGTEVEHVVCYGSFSGALQDPADGVLRRLRSILDQRAVDLPEAIGMALDLLGVRSGRVGVDAAGLVASEWDRVNQRLAPFEVVNGADHLRAARRVKAPFEIECLQRALGIAEEALNEVIQSLARGTTEREAAGAYRAAVVKRDADPYRVLASMGERTSLPLAWPTDRALHPGELVCFDVGCVYRGYHARVVRTAVLGEPTREHDASYRALLASVEAALESMTPGRSASDVVTAAMGAARAQTPAHYEGDRVGHGIGLEACELPELALGERTVLEAGEVLQIGVCFHEVGAVGFAVSETALVALTGARVLNRSARGLITLD
jgi:Xaa-Pro aminopeptidase